MPTNLVRAPRVLDPALGGCWPRSCFANFSTHSFHWDQYETSLRKKKYFPRFVSMEMAVIFDFRALTYNFKTGTSNAVKSYKLHTHIEDIMGESQSELLVDSNAS